MSRVSPAVMAVSGTPYPRHSPATMPRSGERAHALAHMRLISTLAKATTTADIRIHSNGSAESYGFRPLTPAGTAFVNGHAAMVSGRWVDGVFWFWDGYMPREALNRTHLMLVAGIGDSDEYDVEWSQDRRL